MDCLFCNIISGEIPTERLFENEHVIAFRDINPQAPFHALVIPRKHIATLDDATEEDTLILGQLNLAAAHIAREHGFSDQGYRTVINCREHGGQTVYHLHLHLLGGKAMGWPPFTDTLKQPI